MRCNSPLVRGSANADLNTAMTPMIDVVFLLLVFFVWTASFQTIEYVLDSQVAAQQGTNASVDRRWVQKYYLLPRLNVFIHCL